MPMDQNLFQRTLDTLHTYSEIYRNIATTPTPENHKALTQLEEIITDLVDHLATNAKGQVA